MQSEDHENHGISMASFEATEPSLRRCRPQPLASPHPQRELRFLMQAPPGHKVPRSQFSGSQKGDKKKSCKSTGDTGKIRKKESAECILIDKKAKSCKISFVLPSLLAFSGLQCTKGLPSKTRKESGSAVE